MCPRDISKRDIHYDIHYVSVYAINPPHGNPFAAPTIYLFPIFLIKLPNCSFFPALAMFSN
jgi:hypothetical protein